VRIKYAKHSMWSACVFAVAIVGVFWQLTHSRYDVDIFQSRDFPALALVALCVISFWYGCWAFGYAKGYAFLGAVLPFLSLLGLAILVFLPDRSLLAPWRKDAPDPEPSTPTARLQ
jgi:hypothetical protein